MGVVVTSWTKNSELRTQNYLFDLIHSHFCYNNTIYKDNKLYYIICYNNIVQFMFFFVIFLLVKETPIKAGKSAVIGATFYGDWKQ